MDECAEVYSLDIKPRFTDQGFLRSSQVAVEWIRYRSRPLNYDCEMKLEIQGHLRELLEELEESVEVQYKSGQGGDFYLEFKNPASRLVFKLAWANERIPIQVVKTSL